MNSRIKIAQQLIKLANDLVNNAQVKPKRQFVKRNVKSFFDGVADLIEDRNIHFKSYGDNNYDEFISYIDELNISDRILQKYNLNNYRYLTVTGISFMYHVGGKDIPSNDYYDPTPLDEAEIFFDELSLPFSYNLVDKINDKYIDFIHNDYDEFSECPLKDRSNIMSAIAEALEEYFDLTSLNCVDASDLIEQYRDYQQACDPRNDPDYWQDYWQDRWQDRW